MSSKRNAKRTVAKAHRAILKNYRNAQRECVNGCGRAKAGHRYCAACGTALPLTGLVAKSRPRPTAPFVAESAAPTDPLWFGHRDDNDPDPAVREAAWQRQFSGLVTKSQAPAADDAPLLWDPSSADPAERELAFKQAFNHDITKGR